VAHVSLPTLLVEIDFGGADTGTYLHLDDPARGRLDTATWGPDNVWTDVTPWFVRAEVRRGATRVDGPNLRYESGTLRMVLRDDDRRFDPDNLAGPYVSAGLTQVTPMRAIRIQAVYAGTTYPIFRGNVDPDSWQTIYEGPKSTAVVVAASDAYAVFASFDRNAGATVGSGETSGARINRILDSIGWPAADRLVATGDSTLQSTNLADNTLTELLLTADSELGEFYADASGRAVFRNRRAIFSDLRSTRPNAIFGDDPAVPPGVATSINYFSNPDIETDAAGFSAAGLPAPTVARTNTRPHSGTYSIEVTWAGGYTFLPSLWIVSGTAGLIAGKTYTWSAWIYVPAGSPDIFVFEPSVTAGPTITAKDTWTRITLSTNYAGTAKVLGLSATGDGGGAGTKLFVDDVMLTEGLTVPDYFDGGSAYSSWDGVAHASTSRRLPELRYADASPVYSPAYNLITISNTGGTEQIVESAASRQAYLTRTFRRLDLLLQTDAAALDYANFVLAQAKDPERNFDTVMLMPNRDPDNLFPQALGREFGDRIGVRRRPPGGGDPVYREAFIRGMQHIFTEEMQWQTIFTLQSAAHYNFLVLDDLNLGRLDYNSWGY